MSGSGKQRNETVTRKTFTVTVTAGVGTTTLDELLEGFVLKVQVVATGYTGGSITVAEAGGMGQTFASFSGVGTLSRQPRDIAEQPDGTDYTGVPVPMALAQTQLKATVAGGSGAGTVVVMVYLLV